MFEEQLMDMMATEKGKRKQSQTGISQEVHLPKKTLRCIVRT